LLTSAEDQNSRFKLFNQISQLKSTVSNLTEDCLVHEEASKENEIRHATQARYNHCGHYYCDLPLLLLLLLPLRIATTTNTTTTTTNHY
jgi:hypothetical protein